MNCTSPINVEGRRLPCGRCLACRMTRSREWTVRILHELTKFDRAAFVTLTYDEEHLPYNGDLDKPALQRYFKRIRSDKPLRYFACGEYGRKHGRPHYHAILLGRGEDDYDDLDSAWSQGIFDLGTVTRYSVQYVAGYIMDKYAAKQTDLSGVSHKVRPFQLQSQGLGRDWCDAHSAELVYNVGTTLEGKPVSLPRYYKRRLEDDLDDDYMDMLLRERVARQDARYEQLGVPTKDVGRYRQLQAAQAGATLDARHAIYDERDRF